MVHAFNVTFTFGQFYSDGSLYETKISVYCSNDHLSLCQRKLSTMKSHSANTDLPCCSAHRYSFSEPVLSTCLGPGGGHTRSCKTGPYGQGSSSEWFKNEKDCYRMTQQCASSLLGKNPQSM